MKRFLYPLYLLIIVVIMIPKEKLYFTVESYLAENHIYLNNETFSNALVYFDAENIDVLMDAQQIATIGNVRISPWIFLNRFTLNDISFSPLYRNFFPGTVERVVMSYSLLNPLEISIDGEGDFGHCAGKIDWIDQKIRIVFDTTPQLRRYPLLVNKLYQSKEGLVYETSY